MNSNFKFFKISYFMLFFGVAAYYPILGKYYKELGFSGTQIGILFSAATFITMLVQPLWGAICKKLGNCKSSFIVIHIAIIFIALFLPFIKNYWLLLIVMSIHFIFQCGLFPLLDTMIYKDIYDFGKIRLWGSIGFASMVLFSGRLAEILGISNMFFIYSFLMIISLYVGTKIQETASIKISADKKSSGKLFTKDYITFLIIGFFTMGAFTTGGQYFSILFSDIGGSMTAFGITYFFIAISEVPFLKVSQKIVKKYGAEKLIFVSGLLVLGRFGLNGLAKDYRIILYTSIFMGSFIGLSLPAAAVFLKEKVSSENRAMAVTIYSAIGSGLGPMIFQFSGGIIYEHTSISILYLVLCVLILIGIGFSWKLIKNNQISKISSH